MIRSQVYASILLVAIFYSNSTDAQSIKLTPDNLDLIRSKASVTKYKDREALRVLGTDPSVEQIAIVKGVDFKNGTIEVDVAGQLLPDANPSFRGFIGIAFRLQQKDSLQFDCIFIRPTNGRADDQLRRNHSTQYVSIPEYPWYRLRKESPGVYESYVDLVAGEWTKMKIVIRDSEARLYINEANQPCLVVKDLKREATNGAIALWIGAGTDGYFNKLKITKD